MKFFSLNKFHALSSLSNYLDIVIDDNINPLNNERTYIGWNWFSNQKVFEVRKKNGLQSVCVERGALPETIFLDINGFNYNSTSYKEKNWNIPLSHNEKNLIIKYINEYKKDAKLTLEKQYTEKIDIENLKTNLRKRGKFDKIIFVPFQVPEDTVIKNFSGPIKTHENFTKCIKEISRKIPNFAFVYKNHPLKKTFDGNETNLICADKNHYKACLHICDSVITINSGIGLQALIYNKCTFILGNAFYENRNLNIKIKHYSQLIKYLHSDFKPDKVLTYRFLYWLKFKFYSSVGWQDSIYKPNLKVITKINKLNFYDM